MNDAERIELAAGCGDCDFIAKVPGAGAIILGEASSYQLMHNGIKVDLASHYGSYNTEVIKRLRGHHEPQEERAFHEAIQHVSSGGTILELGSFWAYYSLWFLSSVRDARAFLVEPLESALEAGRRNFSLNGRSGAFIRAAVSDSVAAESPIELWPGMTASVATTTVDSLLEAHGITQLDVLHADIQGAEVRMLRGAESALRSRRVKWVFISTHGENLHQKCRAVLRGFGYNIISEHTPGESYSVDGLIVACANPRQQPIIVSRRRSRAAYQARLRAIVRIRVLEPLGLRPRTT